MCKHQLMLYKYNAVNIAKMCPVYYQFNSFKLTIVFAPITQCLIEWCRADQLAYLCCGDKLIVESHNKKLTMCNEVFELVYLLIIRMVSYALQAVLLQRR